MSGLFVRLHKFVTVCLLAAAAAVIVSAQAVNANPGGVSSNLQLWLKTDAGLTSSGGFASNWVDQSPNGYVFTTPSLDPAYLTDATSYYGAVDFNNGAANNYFTTSDFDSVLVNDNATYFVMRSGTASSDFGELLSYFNSGYYDVQPTVNTSVRVVYGSGATPTSLTDNNDGNYHLIAFDRDHDTFEHKFYKNGVADSANPSTGISWTNPPNGALNIGATVSLSRDFLGQVAEIVIFDAEFDSFTAGDHEKIESYLSFKHGLTLDQATSRDYIASDCTDAACTVGTIIWDASDNAGFTNDIFGIGMDTASALNQTQSKSANTDDILSLSAASDQQNLEFLTVANDNDAGSTTPGTIEEQTTELGTSYQGRLDREWRVERAGDLGTVTVTADLTGFFNATDTITLLVDDDSDFSGDLTQTIDAATWDGTTATFTGVNFADGEMFTIASSPGIAGTVYTDAGITNIGAGTNVRLLIDGADSGLTATTGAAGNFIFMGPVIDALAGGEILTLYLDDETENGVTVTVASGPSASGVDIYQDHLITRSDGAANLTSVQLATADNADPGTSSDDISSIYSVDGSNNLTTASGVSLSVADGFSFIPGAAVDVDGNISIGVGSTYDMSTTPTNVAGDFTNLGTLTCLHGSAPDLTFDGGISQNFNPNTAQIHCDILVDGLNTEVVLQNNLDSHTHTLRTTLPTNVFDANGYNVTTGTLENNGDFRAQGSETFSFTQDTDSGTFVYYGDGVGAATTHTITDFGAVDYHDLEINDVSASNEDTFQLGADIRVERFLDVRDGVFDTANNAVDNNTVSNLGGVFVQGDGVLNAGSSNINVMRRWYNTGAFNAGTSTVTFDGTSTERHDIGGGPTMFNNLTIADTGARDFSLLEDVTQTISGAFTADLSSGNEVSIRTSNASTTILNDGSQHTVDVTGSLGTVDYVDVRDALLHEASSLKSPALDPADSVNSGNTSGWFSIVEIELSNAAASSTDESTADNWPTLLVNGFVPSLATVDVDITGGSAVGGGTDYTSADPISLTIPVGSYDGTSATEIAITAPTLNDDSLLEDNETIDLSLTNLVGTDVAIGDANTDLTTQSTHTYTVTDDESATVSITASDDAATENPETNGEFTVIMDTVNSSGSDITVNYAVNGSSTAVAGTDYAVLSGSVNIADGTDSAAITIDTSGLDDALTDGNVTVVVDLASTSHTAVTLGTATQATVTIYDDDLDTDGDGVSDAQEILDGSDETDATSFLDTDGDGAPDYIENNSVPTTDPNDPLEYPDTDSDGVPDYVEVVDGTDPNNAGDFVDSDGGGTSDYAETVLQLNRGQSATDPTDPTDDDTDGDGVSDQEEAIAPGGDGNGDGIPDAQQQEVASRTNPVTGAHVTLEASGGCSFVNGYSVVAESELVLADENFEYPVGLNDFVLECNNPGDSANVTFFYDQSYETSDWNFKKYDDIGNEYSDITDIATFAVADVNGTDVTTVSYTLTDGGITDVDGVADGFINDPAGPAVLVESLSETGESANIAPLVGVMIISAGVAIARFSRARD